MQDIDVVITGIGVVSPLGLGVDEFWSSMCAGQSGVGPVTRFDTTGSKFRIASEVKNFDPKQWVTPRKSLKVMCREIQYAVAAANQAVQNASLDVAAVNRQRFSVVFGAEWMHCELTDVEAAFRRITAEGSFKQRDWGDALPDLFPLWMLQYLPNMPACHIAIANDARGPNNTQALGDVSSLLALMEAYSYLRRGSSDVVIVGGTSMKIHPTTWVRYSADEMSTRNDEPTKASRPFERDRDGMVFGEGAAVFVLETRRHAEQRHAKILARMLGGACGFEPAAPDGSRSGSAIRHSMQQALKNSGVSVKELGHLNAHGLSKRADDRVEATIIREVAGDVPVVVPKSYFGNLGAASGMIEAVTSVLGMVHGQIPGALNYDHPDPQCPINIVPAPHTVTPGSTALLINQSATGQSAAVVLASS